MKVRKPMPHEVAEAYSEHGIENFEGIMVGEISEAELHLIADATPPLITPMHDHMMLHPGYETELADIGIEFEEIEQDWDDIKSLCGLHIEGPDFSFRMLSAALDKIVQDVRKGRCEGHVGYNIHWKVENV